MAKILTRIGDTAHSQTGDEAHLITVRGIVIEFKERDGQEGVHFFSKDTDLRLWKEGPSSGTFNHGVPVISRSLKSILPKEIIRASRRLSNLRFANPVRTHLEGSTILAEVVLDTRRKDEAFVADLVARGLLSWSPGAWRRRVKVDTETGKIQRWGIAEFSLVPTAVYPKAKVSAVRPIEDHELLGRLFGVDVERIMEEHAAALLEFQMLHEDESVFLDE